jgi:deoxycytidylate deaminase
MNNYCAICLEYEVADVINLDCNHHYHTKCIVDYINYLYTKHSYRVTYPCPLCKSNISIVTIKKILTCYHKKLQNNYLYCIQDLTSLRIERFKESLKYFYTSSSKILLIDKKITQSKTTLKTCKQQLTKISHIVSEMC